MSKRNQKVNQNPRQSDENPFPDPQEKLPAARARKNDHCQRVQKSDLQPQKSNPVQEVNETPDPQAQKNGLDPPAQKNVPDPRAPKDVPDPRAQKDVPDQRAQRDDHEQDQGQIKEDVHDQEAAEDHREAVPAVDEAELLQDAATDIDQDLHEERRLVVTQATKQRKDGKFLLEI